MLRSTIFAGALAALPSVLAQDCDCYLIDGNYPTYYSSHGFWDFRSLSQYAVASPPAVPSSRQENTDAPYTSEYFTSDDFTSFWYPMTWNTTVEETGFWRGNSLANLYIENNPDGESDTFFTMRTARTADFQSTAEIEGAEVNHASIRMYARTRGDSGACTSIFTYLGNDDERLVQEADIEILTRDDPDQIHYTNQPSYLHDENGDVEEVPGASHQITIPKPWTEFGVHRIDWTPGRTTYLLDDTQMHTQEFQAPVDPALVDLNAWSDGESWTGLMDVGGQAVQQIQWIEIVYDVTDEGSCNTVCSIDQGTPGQPTKI